MSKKVLIGVTSSIAAYKSIQLVSDLLKGQYVVDVIMSENATKFIQPLTFSSLTKRKTYVGTFDSYDEGSISHITLAQEADVFIVVPATANVIAKIAHGICDDMLTTAFLAADCPKIIAPAMNTKMYENSITQRNISICVEQGIDVITPNEGLLACGDVGVGKLADISVILQEIHATLNEQKILSGKKVLISAGPTIEEIDPVRFITNHSSGKMGYALAEVAVRLGAEVQLVSGPVNIPCPQGVELVKVKSSKEMSTQMKKYFEWSDYTIMAAAVADFTIDKMEHKLKKGTATETVLKMHRTEDILQYLGANKTHQKICGFAMETEKLLEHAQQKFQKKNCDLLVANDLFEPGAGFTHDTNKATLISKEQVLKLPLMSKKELAYKILLTLQEL